MTVPDDPEYPSGLFDSDTKSSGPVSTGITDMNGEVIATVTVEATASYGGGVAFGLVSYEYHIHHNLYKCKNQSYHYKLQPCLKR